jgi:predicted amidophosphoribosyltransferase
MRELERGLQVYLPRVAVEKARTEIVVPQKTLNKLADRVENAARTMVVTEKGKFEKVLLVDDAVGSGATMNEIAKQLKQKQIAQEVIGLAITGSFKGFDVISEV